ncbi:carbonic anhydrase family protein [Flavobacterium sp. AC]|uniref:Carbonic anhydrase family protein n=1 Tax=Flavobacterium azizsancarii TaxID=2961580 RepID=A0ABT4WEK4_9FLAO|nr:carbonic anhydrase family protein [Flavobacterium azizsancarii]MDA6071028.1 carbonic anhydrase family protein [Flavobacterium azizsancarii]
MKKSVVIFSLFFIIGCQNYHSAVGSQEKTNEIMSIDKKNIISSDILTSEQQAKLTPIEVLERLKSGNKAFVEDNLTIRNTTKRVRKASLGQYPKAVILSCLDSRVPVEDVFHSGIGNLFVARVAGNIVNDDILGSLEYACKVSGAKVVLVLGHEYCGAIKSAISNVKLGNITTLLDKIQPAVKEASLNFKGEKTASNEAFVEAVCDANVLLDIDQIRERSSILKEMEQKGEILLVGAVYNMQTGEVQFFDADKTVHRR